MTRFCPIAALCLSSVLLLPWCARGQAAPAGVGPQFLQGFGAPSTAGDVHYSLNASERVFLGQTGAGQELSSTTLFGDLGYLSASETTPFSVLYSGGYVFNTGVTPSNFFHALDLQQGIRRKHWSADFDDDVTYLPDTPTAGLSGLFGVGNPGVPPIGNGGAPNQGILTIYATRVQNDARVSVGVPLTGATSLDATGSYEILRFPSSSTGVESNRYAGGGGVSHRIDARNQVGADYYYDQFDFLGLNGAFTSQTATATYTRQWSRKLRTQFTGGPEFINISNIPGAGSNLNYTATLQANYTSAQSTYSVSFDRSTNSGYGVTYGSRGNTVRATAAHGLGPQTSGTILLTYSDIQSLNVIPNRTFASTNYIASAQLAHAFTPTIGSSASYSVEYQDISGLGAGVVPLNGFRQVLAFGVSYSPQPIRVGRH